MNVFRPLFCDTSFHPFTHYPTCVWHRFSVFGQCQIIVSTKLIQPAVVEPPTGCSVGGMLKYHQCHGCSTVSNVKKTANHGWVTRGWLGQFSNVSGRGRLKNNTSYRTEMDILGQTHCFWHMRDITWVNSMLCNIVSGETIMELQYLCVTICWFIETCKSRCTLSWFTQCWIVVYSLLGPFVFFVWISTSKTIFRKFVGTNCGNSCLGRPIFGFG